jgi:hypothetical protein
MIAYNTRKAERLRMDEPTRLAIEDHLGRQLSEQEWATYRSRLVAFVHLLASWEKSPRAGLEH